MKDDMFYGASPLIFENAKRLRNNVTQTEMILWGRLKEYFPELRFRRQHPLSIYIADFYCHPLKLVLEVDGSVHGLEEVKAHDKERETNLQSLGLTIMRFSNEEINKNIKSVIERIQHFISNAGITPPSGGRGV